MTIRATFVENQIIESLCDIGPSTVLQLVHDLGFTKRLIEHSLANLMADGRVTARVGFGGYPIHYDVTGKDVLTF